MWGTTYLENNHSSECQTKPTAGPRCGQLVHKDSSEVEKCGRKHWPHRLCKGWGLVCPETANVNGGRVMSCRERCPGVSVVVTMEGTGRCRQYWRKSRAAAKLKKEEHHLGLRKDDGFLRRQHGELKKAILQTAYQDCSFLVMTVTQPYPLSIRDQ